MLGRFVGSNRFLFFSFSTAALLIIFFFFSDPSITAHS